LPDLESPEEQVQLPEEPLLLLDPLDPLPLLDLVEEPERALSPDPPSPLEDEPVSSLAKDMDMEASASRDLEEDLLPPDLPDLELDPPPPDLPDLLPPDLPDFELDPLTALSPDPPSPLDDEPVASQTSRGLERQADLEPFEEEPELDLLPPELDLLPPEPEEVDLLDLVEEPERAPSIDICNSRIILLLLPSPVFPRRYSSVPGTTNFLCCVLLTSFRRRRPSSSQSSSTSRFALSEPLLAETSFLFLFRCVSPTERPMTRATTARAAMDSLMYFG